MTMRAGSAAWAMLGAGLLLTAATAATAEPRVSCPAPQQSRMVAELLFGRHIGRHIGVSENAWARFLAREITPRFPDGLTVTDAIGQWRERDGGSVVREPSKRVEIVLPGRRDDQARLAAIAAAYKRRFHQRSVLVVVRAACVAF
jgi:hypothetical protein